jgi:hypothetical protein
VEKMKNGLVAGTLVHTDKGLMPIEQLKVGDMVLSKDESNTGEQAYKRVVSTFKSATRQPIMGIKFRSQTLENLADELRDNCISQIQSGPNDDGTYFDQAKYDPVAKKVTEFFEQRYQCSFDQEEVANQYRGTYEMHLFCTDNHPFWVEGQGWPAANQLERFDKLQGYDGDQLRIELFDAKAYGPLYKTSIAGIAAYTRLDEDDAERFREIMDINFIDFRFGKPTFVLPSLSYRKELFLRYKEDYKAGSKIFCTSANHPLENYYLRFDAPNYPAKLPVGQQLVDYPNEDMDPMRFSTEYDEIETHISLSHRDASNKSLSLKFEDYVYNIEVEDFHTYYVGYAGVLVKASNIKLRLVEPFTA